MDNQSNKFTVLKHGAEPVYYYATVDGVNSANWDGDWKIDPIYPMELDMFDLADLLEESDTRKSIIFDNNREIHLAWSTDDGNYVARIDLPTLQWLIDSELIFQFH